MERNQAIRLWRSAVQLVLGGFALVLVTLFCLWLDLNFATTAFIYLIVNVLLSLMGGFISSAALSLLAVACLNYFFAPQVFNFRADLPFDVLAAIAFLMTSMIVTGLVQGARNKTEVAVQAQKKIEQAERELRLAIDTVPAFVWSTQPDGSLDFINQRWAEIGLSLEDLRGTDWISVIHPDDRLAVADKWRAAVATGTPYENVERVRQADGEYHWFLSRAAPLRNEAGNIVRWYGTDTNIEGQKRAEEAVRQREEELRQLIDVVPQFIFVLGAGGGPIYANRGLLDYQGPSFSLEDFKAKGALERFYHPDDVKGYANRRNDGLSRGAPFETEARRLGKDGQYRWFLLRFNPLRDEHGKIIRWYGTATDIDDRKRAEDALREQAKLLDLTHDTIFVRNMDDVVTYWNRGAEELYGWKREEAVGKISHHLLQAIFPEPLELIAAKMLRSGHWEGELVHAKRDGTKVTVASRWSAQKDERGRLIATLETNNDITVRKRTEEELHLAHAELAHVTRVTTLGQLTASIAHEVNQPLTGIATNGAACLRWLGRETPALDEVRNSVEAMISDANRAAEVIYRIRALAKKTDLEKTSLEINEIIDEVTLLIQREVFSQGISLRLELASALPQVLGDRVQLQQVIINLVMNAIEAMAPVTDRARDLLIRSGRDEGGSILVAVVDSGVGIEPDHVDRLFTAFFTTKSGGMGMGLSICRSIIEAHEGKLSVSPNAGAGATFQFALPAQRQAAS